MASLSDSIRSHRPLLLGLLPLLLVLEGDRPAAAVDGPERRPLPGGAESEVQLPDDGSVALSANETLQPMAQGGARRVVSLAPVRWLSASGEWKTVDASFRQREDGFLTESDSLRCSFPRRGNEDFSVVLAGGGPHLSWTGGALSVERPDGQRLVMAAAPAAVSGVKMGDGSLVYPGVWPGISERYRLEPGLVKHELVLEHLPPASADDKLVLGWTLRVDPAMGSRIRIPTSDASHEIRSDGAGGFIVVDPAGTPRLALPAPFLVEDVDALRLDLQPGLPGLPSDADPASDARPRPLELSWQSEPAGDAIRLELVLPVSELLARADLFPLVIDPTVVDLQSPAGVLTVYGADRYDLLGDKRGLAAGDFNGDGHLDLAAGAMRGDTAGDLRRDAGEVHLLFGPLGAGVRDLPTDKGDAILYGADAFDTLGWSVAAGDLDGDGVDDLLVGAPFADGPANNRSGAGAAHVVLGPFVPGEQRDLGLLPGDAVLHGADRSHGAGYAVAIGDLTGDGIGDAVVSSLRSDGLLGAREGAGAVHVLAGPFLRGPARRVVDLATTPADFSVHGADAGDQIGAALAAGDLDGNGVDDLAFSSLSGDGCDGLRAQAGEISVVLGPVLGPFLDLAMQPADARVCGARPGDLLGHDLAIGDLSGDGVADLVAGAHLSDGPQGARDRAGLVAAVFGPLNRGRSADLAAGGADLLVHGASPTDLAGWSVAAGDLSGDGAADLVLGVVSADGPFDARPSAGELHALIGPFGPGTMIDLASQPSDLEVQGAQHSDQLGFSAGVADLSGDGVGDLFAAAKTARGPGEARVGAGEAVVVQGRAVGCRSDADCDDGVECTADSCDDMTGECLVDEAPCNNAPVCEVGAGRSAACAALLLEGVTIEDADGDALEFSWVSSDPAVSISPASGSVPAGSGSWMLPPSLVALEQAALPCGREAVLTLSVSDGRGGATSCHLRVSFRDESSPMLLGVPADATVGCDSVPPAPMVMALDGCDPEPQLSMTEVRTNGSCPGEYTLVRTWRAVDACGNAAEARQVVEVVDEDGPVVHASNQRLRCLWPPNHQMVHFTTEDFVPEMEDACSGPSSFRFVDCASNQPDDDTGDGSTEPDCVVDEDGLGFSVRAERAGNKLEQRRYSIVVVATDACGNESAPTRMGHVGVSHDRGLLVGAGDCTGASGN